MPQVSYLQPSLPPLFPSRKGTPKLGVCQVTSASGLQGKRLQLIHPGQGLERQRSPGAFGQAAAFPQGSRMRESSHCCAHGISLVPRFSHWSSLSNQAGALQGNPRAKSLPAQTTSSRCQGLGLGLLRRSALMGGRAAGAGAVQAGRTLGRRGCGCSRGA